MTIKDMISVVDDSMDELAPIISAAEALWGREHQLLKHVEETAEAAQQIIKYVNTDIDRNKDALADELADELITWLQAVKILGYEQDVAFRFLRKMQRLREMVHGD